MEANQKSAETETETEQKVMKIGTYFDQVSVAFIEEYEKKGLKKHTDIIFNFFEDIDLSTFSVLELGCGLGGLLLKFLDQGVEHVYGVDLSEKMIENARVYAKSKSYTQKVDYFVGDFNKVSKGVLPISQVDIVVSDRVLCCSPVALDIMRNKISFNPKYIVAIQPRKNFVSHFYMWLRIQYRQYKLKIKNHGVKNPYVPVKEYDRLCKKHGYERVLQKFRFGWEVLIYKKKNI